MSAFLKANGWLGIDAVGSSLGARVVLEMARRGDSLGAVVALDPGGFWKRWQGHAFFASAWLSVRVLRALAPWLPALTRSRLGRALLLSRLSAAPSALPPRLRSTRCAAMRTRRRWTACSSSSPIASRSAVRRPKRCSIRS